MTITYSDGRTHEAVLLSHADDTIRAIIEGSEDVTELRKIHGVWVSDDCEPVHVQFAWQKIAAKPDVSLADCCCSRDLAAKLVRLLFTDSREHPNVPIEMIPASRILALKRSAASE